MTRKETETERKGNRKENKQVNYPSGSLLTSISPINGAFSSEDISHQLFKERIPLSRA